MMLIIISKAAIQMTSSPTVAGERNKINTDSVVRRTSRTDSLAVSQPDSAKF